jgi:hypothetical protein
MPHDHCPPNLRGHTWRELPLVPPSEGGPTIRALAELRKCARCGAIGRLNSQGVILVERTAQEESP